MFIIYDFAFSISYLQIKNAHILLGKQIYLFDLFIFLFEFKNSCFWFNLLTTNKIYMVYHAQNMIDYVFFLLLYFNFLFHMCDYFIDTIKLLISMLFKHLLTAIDTKITIKFCFSISGKYSIDFPRCWVCA